MNLNSDAIQNVKNQRFYLETGVIKATTEGVGILSPDISYSGIVANIKVGETTALLDFLCYDNTANALKKLDADVVATVPCVAVALEVATSGNYCKVFLYGYMKLADLDFGLDVTDGTITFSGTCAEGDKIIVNGTTYELTTGTVAAGDVKIDCTAAFTAAVIRPLLVAAINTTETNLLAANAVGEIVTVSNVGDIARNVAITDPTDTNGKIAVVSCANGINGYKIWAGLTAGEHLFAVSASPDINNILGQALSRRELWFNPMLYTLVGA